MQPRGDARAGARRAAPQSHHPHRRAVGASGVDGVGEGAVVGAPPPTRVEVPVDAGLRRDEADVALGEHGQERHLDGADTVECAGDDQGVDPGRQLPGHHVAGSQAERRELIGQRHALPPVLSERQRRDAVEGERQIGRRVRSSVDHRRQRRRIGDDDAFRCHLNDYSDGCVDRGTRPHPGHRRRNGRAPRPRRRRARLRPPAGLDGVQRVLGRAVRPRSGLGPLPRGTRRPRHRQSLAGPGERTAARSWRAQQLPAQLRGRRHRRPGRRHVRYRGATARSCVRCSPARRSGASCSASPAPDPIWPRVATDAPARRRRVGDQRPQGVDDDGPLARWGILRRPDRPRPSPSTRD